MTKKLKLFVWNEYGTLTDYSNGMICVLAHDLEEALRLINKKDSMAESNFQPSEYKIIEKPEAFICWGGSG